jgi:2-C-methyl-D-erythritol 4-phosphate cytidylyltransferase
VAHALPSEVEAGTKVVLHDAAAAAAAVAAGAEVLAVVQYCTGDAATAASKCTVDALIAGTAGSTAAEYASQEAAAAAKAPQVWPCR